MTQSLRGIEGAMTGDLHSNIGGLTTTAQEWRDKFLQIKAQPGRSCWLTFGDRTIQVRDEEHGSDAEAKQSAFVHGLVRVLPGRHARVHPKPMIALGLSPAPT